MISCCPSMSACVRASGRRYSRPPFCRPLAVSCVYRVMTSWSEVLWRLGNPFFRQNAGTVGTDVKQDWVDQLFWIRLFLVGSLWNSELFARKKLL